MPPLAKDSAIIILRATTGAGYFLELYHWSESPPPVPFRNLDKAEAPTENRLDQVFADKAALKAQFATFVDNMFDT